jgi:hypothetical protein
VKEEHKKLLEHWLVGLHLFYGHKNIWCLPSQNRILLHVGCNWHTKIFLQHMRSGDKDSFRDRR